MFIMNHVENDNYRSIHVTPRNVESIVHFFWDCVADKENQLRRGTELNVVQQHLNKDIFPFIIGNFSFCLDKSTWPIGHKCFEELKELVDVFPQLNNRRWKQVVKYFDQLDAYQHYVDTGEWLEL